MPTLRFRGPTGDSCLSFTRRSIGKQNACLRNLRLYLNIPIFWSAPSDCRQAENNATRTI